MATRTDNRRSDDIADSLYQSIRRGEPPLGAYLPPSRTLARQFGVSINTVQIALRDLEARRVIECQPRRGALVKARQPDASIGHAPARPITRRNIGLIGPTSLQHSDHWTSSIINHAVEAIRAEGLNVVLLPVVQSGGDGIDQLRTSLDASVDDLAGILSFCFPQQAIDLVKDELERRGIPRITLVPTDPDNTRNYVMPANLPIARLLGHHFATTGQHRVWIVTTDTAIRRSALDKATGIFQGFLQAGVDTSQIRVLTVPDGNEMTGYIAIKNAMTNGPAPHIVFAEGDLLAIGAIHALHEASLNVPGDVGVIGGTGGPTGETHAPALTVIAQPVARMGHQAGSLLCNMIRHGMTQTAGQWIPCELVLRDSLKLSADDKAELLARYEALASLDTDDQSGTWRTGAHTP